MVEKTFCNDCGKDITNDETWSASIYDDLKEEFIIEADLCKKCKDKLKGYFPKA